MKEEYGYLAHAFLLFTACIFVKEVDAMVDAADLEEIKAEWLQEQNQIKVDEKSSWRCGTMLQV